MSAPAAAGIAAPVTDAPATTGRRDGAAQSGRSEIRPDIQALRALAVLGVLGYHVKPDLVTGGFVGVDVFFVLSGFLISSHLFGELLSTGRISLGRFWSRRVRRLLPASLTVLGATAAGVALLVPEALHERFFRDITGAAFYVANWLFASQSVDYSAAADGAESPVLHFWSLGVEEQLYLFWPLLLIAGSVWLGRRLPQRAALATAVIAVAAPSFALSAVLVLRGDPSAYFVTTTRVWEFAAGALVGLAMLGRRQRPLGPARVDGVLRLLASYAGWAVLVGYIVLFRVELGFPGVNALGPVLGTALVLWADDPRGRGSLGGLLAARPLQLVGRTSYSIYLWHWPILVLAPYALIAATAGGPLADAQASGILTPGLWSLIVGTGGTAVADLTWLQLLVLVVLVLVLSWCTTRFVEDPFRFSRFAVRLKPARTFALALAAMLVLAVGVELTSAATARSLATQRARDLAVEQELAAGVSGTADRTGTWDERTCMGPPALAEPECAEFTWAATVPAIGVAEETARDVVPVWTDREFSSCLSFNDDYSVHHCVFGVMGGRRVALVGDSHAFHWLPAFNALAEQEDLELHFFARSGCAFSLAPTTGPADHVEGCSAWSRELLPLLVENRYDVVAISNWAALRFAQGSFDSAHEAGVDGYARAWEPVIESGAELVVVRDTPTIGDAAWGCAQANPADVNRCSPSQASAFKKTDPRLAAAAGLDVEVLDFTDYFCAADVCPISIGGVRVYRDANHMTGTYNLLLTPYLKEKLL